MDYRILGRSGCAVSSLCLGTMTFGVETDEPDAHQQLDRFLEAGGTFVDTADVYGDGRSEEIIGRWFASRPAEVTEPVVLATKGRFPRGGDDSPNGAGLSARHLTRALDASLRRLGLESVDLYQVHAYDPLTPLEETLRTLDQFIRVGKIRYYGLSNFTGFVHDSGEGRWTVQAAIESSTPAEVLTAALYARFRSRQEHTFAEKILSAMRYKFGGHVERASGG